MDHLDTLRLLRRFLKNFILLCALLLLAFAGLGAAEGGETAKYIFLFIGDGMGEAQVRAAELYSLAAGDGKLAFSAFPVASFNWSP